MNAVEFIGLPPRDAFAATYRALDELGFELAGPAPSFRFAEMLVIVVTEGWMPPSDMPLPVSKEPQ